MVLQGSYLSSIYAFLNVVILFPPFPLRAKEGQRSCEALWTSPWSATQSHKVSRCCSCLLQRVVCCLPLCGVPTVGLMYEPRVGNLSVLVGGERAEDTKLRLLASDIICDLSIDALPVLSVFSEWR